MRNYIIQDFHYTHNHNVEELFDLVIIRDNGQKFSCSYTKDELMIIYKTIANFLGIDSKVKNEDETTR